MIVGVGGGVPWRGASSVPGDVPAFRISYGPTTTQDETHTIPFSLSLSLSLCLSLSLSLCLRHATVYLVQKFEEKNSKETRFGHDLYAFGVCVPLGGSVHGGRIPRTAYTGDGTTECGEHGSRALAAEGFSVRAFPGLVVVARGDARALAGLGGLAVENTFFPPGRL